MKRHLVVMIRRPRLGRVKGRLAKDVGPVRAWQTYHRLARVILHRLVGDPRWHCWLSVTPDHESGDRGAGLPVSWHRGWSVLEQGDGDLGQRMTRPARRLPPGPVVVVGSDVPGLSKNHVWSAFRALGAHDLVFGPSEDGGFWLVGFRRRPTLVAPFDGVAWSRSDTLLQCLNRIPEGKTVTLINRLWDVDDGNDLRRLEQDRNILLHNR